MTYDVMSQELMQLYATLADHAPYLTRSRRYTTSQQAALPLSYLTNGRGEIRTHVSPSQTPSHIDSQAGLEPANTDIRLRLSLLKMRSL